MSAGSDGLRMTPEHRVWKALNAVPGEAYEPRDVCVMTGLPAVVVESVLSNMDRRGLVRWDPVGEWYEARPTTLDAPWYGCGCSPYLYPTPGQLVVLASGDVVEVQGFDPNPYAVLVSGMGWLGQYRWQCLLTGLPISEVWSAKKKPIPPWTVTGDGTEQRGLWDE